MIVSPYDPFRTIDCREGRVRKTTDLGRSTSQALRRCLPEEEFAILSHLDGLAGTPKRVRLEMAHPLASITYDYIPGIPLDRVSPGPAMRLRIAGAALLVLARVSMAGVAHGDVVLRNFLLGPDGSVHLIDFDQAARCPRRSAFLANFLGRGRFARHGSFVATFCLGFLAGPLLRRLRRRDRRGR
jgi:RIO-like serine/threonine protein kinase